ncbi:mitochondrial 2-oxoglutarate/malate carrier protein-like isoform X2 [Drosophila ficusphila]|uniref:mitochondrial 2-oxoglutarate/malate carrier protein-like isoform X2 n=1 Tax=Drosophila ficusphila TaxID=30025 RepID=UPI0007E60546|nr:mitochondrial 2-oxoglutarate/malate carrier protein-like isoform X2 [Drosophila ficusphila]
MPLNVNKKHMPRYVHSINFGVSATMAAFVLHPVDLVKVRMQQATKGEFKSSLDLLVKVVKNEGIRALYKGLSAGLIRQMTYTTIREGFFDWGCLYHRKLYNRRAPFYLRMGICILGAGIGALIATPAEVAMIRMMSDNRLPPEERRNYKNLVDAFARIAKEEGDEGVLALWRGCMPTVGRSMVVNMLQFGSYSQLKGLRPEYFSGLSLQISAAMLTSVLTTMASMLLDMAKTRIQQQKTGEYKGIFDVLMKVSKNEGIFALWKGFTPYLLRRGLNIVFADFFTEQLTKAYKRYVLGED